MNIGASSPWEAPFSYIGGETVVITDVMELVRRKINDIDCIEFTDEEVLKVVNEALRFIREIYMDEMPDLLIEVDSAMLEHGENKVELPAKLLKLTDVRCNGRMLHFAMLRNIQDIDRMGSPKVYALTRKYIQLYPIPDQAMTCTYSYITESPEYTYDDDFPFPVDFAQYVEEYAAIRLGTVVEADVSMETQIYGQLRSSIVTAIQKLVPDTCVVDSYY